MSIPWALAVPVIVFFAVVVPLWLRLHYKTQWKRLEAGEIGPNQVAVDREEIKRLHHVADRLSTRIDALETLLDAELPEWRHK